MDLYFDTCALNRLADGGTSPRVRAESAAVLRLLDLVAGSELRWIASPVLRAELEQNPNSLQRDDILAVLDSATEVAAPTQSTVRRAIELEAAGLRGLDSLHLALAEQAGVDWLVTTDDRFLRFAMRHLKTAAPQVINPVDLIQRRFPWLLPTP